MNIFRWIEFFGYLAKEILFAAVQVVGYAVFMGPRITPALVKIPIRVTSPRGVYLLSSVITLTPGTVSVDVEDGVLLVHVIHTTSPEDVVTKIQRGFEDRILVLLGEAK